MIGKLNRPLMPCLLKAPLHCNWLGGGPETSWLDSCWTKPLLFLMVCWPGPVVLYSVSPTANNWLQWSASWVTRVSVTKKNTAKESLVCDFSSCTLDTLSSVSCCCNRDVICSHLCTINFRKKTSTNCFNEEVPVPSDFKNPHNHHVHHTYFYQLHCYSQFLPDGTRQEQASETDACFCLVQINDHLVTKYRQFQSLEKHHWGVERPASFL